MCSDEMNHMWAIKIFFQNFFHSHWKLWIDRYAPQKSFISFDVMELTISMHRIFCCCFLLVKGQLSFHYHLNNNNNKRFVKLFQSLWSLCLGYWMNVSLWAEFNIQIGQDIKHPWGVCCKAGTYLVSSELGSVVSIAILFIFTDEETELQRR